MTKKQGSLNSTTNTKAIDEGDPLENESLELPLTTKPFAVFIENFTLAQSTEPLSVISSDGAHAMKAFAMSWPRRPARACR